MTRQIVFTGWVDFFDGHYINYQYPPEEIEASVPFFTDEILGSHVWAFPGEILPMTDRWRDAGPEPEGNGGRPPAEPFPGPEPEPLPGEPEIPE